jgi:Protein of unknown function (DUF2961)
MIGGLGLDLPERLRREPPRTRQVSPENPTGARGAGARAVPDPSDPDLPHSAMAAELGAGFKVRPFVSLAAGATVTLAELTGGGTITNLFITSNAHDLRDLRLCIRWDGDDRPAVAVNLASFFCLGGRGQAHPVTSAAINVGPVRGCTSSWPMPYRDGARITIDNVGELDVDVIAYKVTYNELANDAVPGYRFHAITREEPADPVTAEFTLLQAPGQGLVVGTSVSWTTALPRWWGEGEVKTYFGNDDYPSLVDTGTEDYFGGAWGFGRDTTFLPQGPAGERTYCGPYAGAPYLDTNEGYPREIVLYRWHILDPIGFHDGVRMTVQQLGTGPDRRYEKRPDHLVATGYWYQSTASRADSGTLSG